MFGKILTWIGIGIGILMLLTGLMFWMVQEATTTINIFAR